MNGVTDSSAGREGGSLRENGENSHGQDCRETIKDVSATFTSNF